MQLTLVGDQHRRDFGPRPGGVRAILNWAHKDLHEGDQANSFRCHSSAPFSALNTRATTAALAQSLARRRSECASPLCRCRDANTDRLATLTTLLVSRSIRTGANYKVITEPFPIHVILGLRFRGESPGKLPS